MTDSRERAAQVLRGPDGERTWLALVAYAPKIAQRYGWRTDKTLPQAFSPREVAEDVLIKVLEGTRTWDEGKEPCLLKALKGMVRSDIGHLYDDSEATRTDPIARTLPDGRERTADNFAGNSPTPEKEVLQAEQALLEATALDMILEQAKGNPELESVLLELYDNNSPKEIARRTGLPIERVYSLRRELDRIAAKITPVRIAREALRRRGNG